MQNKHIHLVTLFCGVTSFTQQVTHSHTTVALETMKNGLEGSVAIQIAKALLRMLLYQKIQYLEIDPSQPLQLM